MPVDEPGEGSEEAAAGDDENSGAGGDPDDDGSGASADFLFEPSVEMMVNDFDDEQTLEEEERLAAAESEDPNAELSSLQRVRAGGGGRTSNPDVH